MPIPQVGPAPAVATDLVTKGYVDGVAPIVRRVGTQVVNSTVTGAKITALDVTLGVGTYVFEYTMLLRSATTTVGPMLGVNFTGTGNPRMIFSFADHSTSLLAEVHSMSNQGSKAFGFIVGMASSAKSTTSPDMGTTVGVNATATDILCFVKGIIIVTAGGDLQLYHSSETATTTSVEVGSSLVVIKTA